MRPPPWQYRAVDHHHRVSAGMMTSPTIAMTDVPSNRLPRPHTYNHFFCRVIFQVVVMPARRKYRHRGMEYAG
ncbi:hypothetical protein KCP69_21980 [Salmonella enterica subsp. enterica]|nr:hypothetical protein KCP69_21980 [Salmonella enterica subsp. enterica]